MKQLVQIILVCIVAIGTVAVIIVADVETRGAVTVQQEQPKREPYVAPIWVTNDSGQLCIKQGSTVTCG
jgi:hypothetical protein